MSVFSFSSLQWKINLSGRRFYSALFHYLLSKSQTCGDGRGAQGEPGGGVRGSAGHHLHLSSLSHHHGHCGELDRLRSDKVDIWKLI